MENVGISGVSFGNQWIPIHSATTLQTVQINILAITWPNVVSCLAVIIFNDNLKQMSVKRIRLYIGAKRKIYDNNGHKGHSTHSPRPYSLFVDISQILTHPLPEKTAQFYIKSLAKWHLWYNGT